MKVRQRQDNHMLDRLDYDSPSAVYLPSGFVLWLLSNLESELRMIEIHSQISLDIALLRGGWKATMCSRSAPPGDQASGFGAILSHQYERSKLRRRGRSGVAAKRVFDSIKPRSVVTIGDNSLSHLQG